MTEKNKPTIELPKRVRIGALDFEIENWDSQEASSSRRYGECNSTTQKIRVDTQFSAVRTASTLLHEILHQCCNHGAYYVLEKPTEEQTVTQFTDMLTQVWQDNPDVMEWIGKNVRSK